MYENKIIFTMSDGSNHSYELTETENKLSEKEMNDYLKKIFRSDYINCLEHNEYVALNISQVAYIRFKSRLCSFSRRLRKCKKHRGMVDERGKK